MFQALIGPIASLAGSFVEGQVSKQKAKATLAQTEAEAKAEIMKTAATHDSKWELIMAESTKSSIKDEICLLYTSPSPRDKTVSRMPSSA